jgi:hypothetical protein
MYEIVLIFPTFYVSFFFSYTYICEADILNIIWKFKIIVVYLFQQKKKA